jgi:hypothetical protein
MNGIIANNEPKVKLTEIASDLGKSPATVGRWCLQGILRNGRRIRLEHIRVGRDIMTSRAAFDRFSAALAEVPDAAPVGVPLEERRRRVTEAEAALIAAGC